MSATRTLGRTSVARVVGPKSSSVPCGAAITARTSILLEGGFGDFSSGCHNRREVKRITGLKTAGAGGPETLPCKVLGDDLYDLLALIVSIVADQTTLQSHGLPVNSTVTKTLLLFDFFLVKAIEVCQTYIAEVLQLIYKKHPASLGGSEKVEFAFVLGFDSIEKLVSAVVEQRVQALSYKSMADLDAYVQKVSGFSLFVNEDQRQHASWLVEVRNLMVHNRGIVNGRFLDRQPVSDYKIGDHLNISLSENSEHLIFLIDWIVDLDMRLIEKFSLPSLPRSPRPKLPVPWEKT